MTKTSIKKDDYVMIIAGKDKNKTAQVIAIDRDSHRALIEGKDLLTVNKKAVKARKASDKGGLIEQPGSVDVSNLMPICAACNKPTRVGYKEADGKKIRVCIKCGEELITKKSTAKKAGKKDSGTKAAVRKKAKPAGTEAAAAEKTE